jgi:integrase
MGFNLMPRVNIKYVKAYKDRHGKERLYFRRGRTPQISLRSPIGSSEFWQDYNAALSGHTLPNGRGKLTSPTPTSQGTVRWLCIEYFKSAAYTKLENSTQSVRRGILERFCQEYGHLDYSNLERHHLLKIRDKKADVPESANGLIKALRQVFKFAIEYGYHDTNPAANVPYLKSNNPGGFHAWTMTEIERFEEKHPIGTKARLAMALLLYTCQRRSDIIQFGRQHIIDNRLEFTQHKGRNRNPIRLSIPILSELRRIIDASPCGDLNFLVTAFNKPFTSNGFGNRIRKWCDEAGLTQCSAHGLRKAAATRMAELGCSEHEIMAIGGWKTLKEVERYTRAARQKVLADNATVKLEAAQNKNKSV